MNQPTHRDTAAFLSRACGQGKHYACSKLNCTCHCHMNTYARAAELMDESNFEAVLAILGFPGVYRDG